MLLSKDIFTIVVSQKGKMNQAYYYKSKHAREI